MQNSKLQPKIKNLLILFILFFLPSYLIKIKFGWLSFNALELLVGALFVFWIFSKEKKHFILSAKYFIPVILILLGLASSVITNNNFYVGLGAIKGWFIFPLIFAIILYDALEKDENLLKKTALSLFLSGVAISAIGIVYKFLGLVTFDDRLKIFWDSPNQLAMFLAVPFLAGIYFISQDKNKTRLYALGSALIGLGLFFTFSYGAWLALAAALMAMLWFGYGKIAQKKYLAIWALLLLSLFAWASVGKYKNIENLGERSSLASRIAIWKSAELMAKNNPFFGIGPGNFQSKYLEYQKYFPPYLEWSAPQPHNVFLAFWLQAGIIGLTGFIILLVYFFRDNKIAIVKNRGLGTLLFGIMIYVLLHGLADTTYWRNDLAVVFWTVIVANLYLTTVAEEPTA